MARVAGWLLVVLLVGLVGALRWQVQRRAEGLLRGEEHALAVVRELTRASDAAFADAGTHPGLGAVLADGSGLVVMAEHGDAERSFARDDVYVYALARTAEREEGQVRRGWVLRAWPIEFGITGDAEYHVSETGTIWQGHNERGRSGTGTGFPPPFPEPGLEQARRFWRPLPRTHR